MNVRRAEPRDLDAVCALEGSSEFTAHWTRGQFEKELGNPGFIVAEDGGAVVGFAVALLVDEETQLLDIAVETPRKGVGKALIEALPGRRILLEVSSRNDAARDFYSAQGFRVVGRRPKFYNDGSDAVLMDLDR